MRLVTSLKQIPSSSRPLARVDLGKDESGPIEYIFGPVVYVLVGIGISLYKLYTWTKNNKTSLIEFGTSVASRIF